MQPANVLTAHMFATVAGSLRCDESGRYAAGVESELGANLKAVRGAGIAHGFGSAISTTIDRSTRVTCAPRVRVGAATKPDVSIATVHPAP